MQNAMLMRVVNGARHLGDEFYRLTDWHWFTLDHGVKLAAIDEFHAEIAGAVAFADFVDGNNAGMIKAGSGFRFPAKTLQMRIGSPMPEANYFESYYAVETFLPRAIDHTLASPTDYV